METDLSDLNPNFSSIIFKDHYPIHESWLPEIFNDTAKMFGFLILDTKSHF